MAMTFRTVLCAGVAAAILQAAPARADDVTAAQASAIEAQIRASLSGLLGPAVKLPDRMVEMTPAGDHYDVVVPMKVQASGTPTTIRVTATARPLDGGKWSIEKLHTDMPLRFTIDMPLPPKDGKPAGTAPATYTITIEGQDGQIQLDPSLATPTTSTSSSTGATIHVDGTVAQDTKIGPYNAVAALRPAGPDRVDISSDATMADYVSNVTSAEYGPMQIGMKLLRVSMGMTGVNRAHAVTLVQNTTAVISAALAAGSAPQGKPPKLSPEVVKALLGALQDFATDFNLDETFEGMSVKVAGHEGQLAKGRVGFGAKSDGGILQARMDMGMAGLTLPDMPLGPIAGLIPSEVAFRPFVSGVAVTDLMRVLSATGAGRDPTPQEYAALFSHGGIVTGLESLTIAAGGATFTSQGKLVFTSPSDMNGTAQITAEHFDELMDKVSAIPAFGQAIPVMAFLKGLGRIQDNKLTWNVSYASGKLLVNNVDLSAMAGGPPAAPAQGSPKPARPAPNRR